MISNIPTHKFIMLQLFLLIFSDELITKIPKIGVVFPKDKIIFYLFRETFNPSKDSKGNIFCAKGLLFWTITAKKGYEIDYDNFKNQFRDYFLS